MIAEQVHSHFVVVLLGRADDLTHPVAESLEGGIHLGSSGAVGVHDGVELRSEEIAELDVASAHLIQQACDIGLVVLSPVRARPCFAGFFPRGKDGGLSTDDSTWFVEVAFLGIVEPRQSTEGDTIELEITGVAQAMLPSAAHFIAHAMVGRNNVRQPPEPTRGAEGRVFGIKYEEREMAVFLWGFPGEDTGVTGAGVAQQSVAF